jgi:hypothetical protein
MDGLFWGVFLQYVYHFRPEIIANLFRPLRNCVAIGLLTAALLSCCLIFGRDSGLCLMSKGRYFVTCPSEQFTLLRQCGIRQVAHENGNSGAPGET